VSFFLRDACVVFLCGKNDLADLRFTENVCIDAGASDADFLDPAVMERIIPDTGRSPRQQPRLYEIV